MDNNKPREREKNVTGSVKVYKRGEGTGNGPVGKGYGKSGGGSGAKRAAVGGGASIIVVIIAVLMNMLGGGSNEQTPGGNINLPSNTPVINTGSLPSSATSYSKIDTNVAAGSRAKRTEILGNGSDKVTIMIYMCGTDLESKSGMASSDIQEMTAATLSDNVNIIIFTGGCSSWKISGISNSVNQIYRVENGKLRCLEADMGTKSMTDPSNLAAFIQYCNKNYPANRNELIMWDHGGGSVSGYGYDEKNKNSGSMNLSGINTALKNGGVKFDFVGFDACLMATAETALMMNEYADYLIASEETEPGIGWYYTNWLTNLSKNTSMSTLEVGKNIVDDFVSTCDSKCRGQKTTLSVIDLAEFSNTVPDKLSAFAKSVSGKLQEKKYDEVSNARSDAREFATSSKIDQIDLVDLAKNIGGDAGNELASALKSAVKYNRTSSNMTDAYGVSIYFPYKKTSYVDKACNTYDMIGMDDEYAKCIKQFASLETSGQIAAGGSGTESPLGSLLGLGSSSTGSSGSSDVIGQLLTSFLTGGRSIAELDETNTEFMKDKPLGDDTAEYLATNYFDVTNLTWKKDGDKIKISMPKTQWDMVRLADKCMYLDDGKGYIDLGMDNVYSWDGDDMVADTELTWLGINGQVVAYYHTDTQEDGDSNSMFGYVPAMLNGEPVQLNIVFDNANPHGYIAGVTSAYKSGETDTVAKSDLALNVGDKLDFTCDYYTYDGEFVENYYLGEQLTVTDNMTVSDLEIENGKAQIMYCFTDMYNQMYYTESIDLQ